MFVSQTNLLSTRRRISREKFLLVYSPNKVSQLLWTPGITKFDQRKTFLKRLSEAELYTTHHARKKHNLKKNSSVLPTVRKGDPRRIQTPEENLPSSLFKRSTNDPKLCK